MTTRPIHAPLEPLRLFTQHTWIKRLTSAFCVCTTLLFSTGLAEATTASGPGKHPLPNPTPLIEFTSPTRNAALTQAVVSVKLQLNGEGARRKLKIYANGKDVTASFYTGDCGSGPCQVSGSLTLGSQLVPGWNTIRASVRMQSGAVDRSLLKFYEKTNQLGDSTTGAQPPYGIHVAMSSTQGIEVDYNPDNNPANAPYFYPGSNPSCTSGGLTIIRLDRSTLKYISTTCYGPQDNSKLQSDLQGFTEQDLLLASTGTALGALNMSAIGGTDFTALAAQKAYKYQIIGYGGAAPGIATESYNTSADAPWHGIEGNLVDIGTNSAGASLYGFQATNAVGFAVVPNGINATVTVGNTQNLPIGPNAAPLSNVPAGFSNITYSAPAVTGTGGGIWLLVLDRYTLQLVSSTTYSARNSDNSENKDQVNNLLSSLSQLDHDSQLVFLSTLVGPDKSGNYGSTPLNTELTDAYQYTNALFYIMKMGISPFAFDKAMGLQWGLGYPSSAFAMVGIPNNFISFALPNVVPPSNISCANPPTSTYVCGGNKDQWFSSALDTQQKETGALQGSLVRNRNFQYAPADVSPFAPASGAQADDLLSNNISRAVGTAPLVAWPMYDTPGRQAAYGYLSSLLVAANIEKTSTCGYDAKYCGDIRYYYSGDQAADLGAPKLDPINITCAAGSGFNQQDCSNVQKQLSQEFGFIQNVLNYQTALKTIHDDGTSNLGIQLSTAALDVATQIDSATNNTLVQTGQDPMSLATDSLGVLSGITSSIGAFFPPAGVFSGICGAAGGLLSIIKDSQKSMVNSNDEVDKLNKLIATSSESASTAATAFNNDLLSATDSFFDGIYSDWFKLQAVAQMAGNPDAAGWYYGKSGSAESFAPYLLAAARKNFYMQISGLYFSTKYIRTYGYAPRNPTWSTIPNQYATPDVLSAAVRNENGLQNITGLYTWDYRDTLPYLDAKTNIYSDGVWDYNFVVLTKNQKASWPNDFGNTLMGPQNLSDGTGNLNLNRDVLYDSGLFPTISQVFWAD